MEQKSFFYQMDRMSLHDFKLFQKMIYTEAGINLTEKKMTLLSNRIRKRLKALKLESYYKYYQYLKKAEDKEKEIVKMINTVTTNVTHFFRNPKQFDLFKNKVLPDIIKNNHKRKSIKILSAGCSTGEEPYSIAIILLEYFKEELMNWYIEIEGVDISTDVINKAQTGMYKKEKIKDIDYEILNKYFVKIDDSTYQINNKAKSITKFKRFNLKSDNFSSNYDVIFCRNVVIYFDRGIKEEIYQKFHGALRNKGYFLAGHSEGMLNNNRFHYICPGIYIKN